MHPSKQILHPWREQKWSPCCVGEFACAGEEWSNKRLKFKAHKRETFLVFKLLPARVSFDSAKQKHLCLFYFGKMNIVGALLLLFATSASADGTIGECKSFCNRIRKEALAEKRQICEHAIKQSSTRKMFNVCVDARKKAFDQACNPLCERVECQFLRSRGVR
jgi:hypothetical protein